MKLIILSATIIALIILSGCTGSTVDKSGMTKEKALASFKASSCGGGTMDAGMLKYAGSQGANKAVVEDAWKSGDGWDIRISHIGNGKTFRFSYLWLPDKESKFADSDDARALNELCQTDGWLEQ